MKSTGENHNTNFCQTFHKEQFGRVASIVEQLEDINKILKRFRDLETHGALGLLNQS